MRTQIMPRLSRRTMMTGLAGAVLAAAAPQNVKAQAFPQYFSSLVGGCQRAEGEGPRVLRRSRGRRYPR